MIDTLTERDRSGWAELWTGYLKFYDTIMPQEQYDYTWSRLMGGTLHALVLRDDGRMIGLVHFLFHESAWTLRPVCYLQDLYVEPGSRGTGGGRALIEAVADAAREAQAPRLYWLTQDHNEVGRRLYDRLAKHSGFIRYEYSL